MALHLSFTLLALEISFSFQEFPVTRVASVLLLQRMIVTHIILLLLWLLVAKLLKLVVVFVLRAKYNIIFLHQELNECVHCPKTGGKMCSFTLERTFWKVDEALEPLWHPLNLYFEVCILVLDNLNHNVVVLSEVLKELGEVHIGLFQIMNV